ncbi:hypothetical protein [Gillisia limnaea]|uniref:Lipoprotein n=1 Tax=Gillisia limnaea (strain DSM 15749 / LMG 21470 / R-8282) TaxID=865937 RepID=H2BWI7_GILLR|nr:hypothetical protein [Gillisia limnaea]EHQ01930.1 hypothetical protein Gilli_1262 [Gillisia limnaea DSM 15749]
MKKLVLTCLLTAFIAFSGCNSAEENLPAEGIAWELVETKVSIGGLTEFTPTDKIESIEFLSNNKVRNTNGWCGEGSPQIAEYAEGVITTNCNRTGKLNFKIDGTIMIVSNPACIEGCDYKYQKVKK